MRTNKKLAIENLERREVFSVASGFEGLTPDTQVSDQEIIDALNNGTQLTSDALVVDQSGSVGFFDGSDVGLSVASPRDAKSGMPTGMRHEIVLGSLDGDFANAAAVDQLFAEYQVTARPGTSISGL